MIINNIQIESRMSDSISSFQVREGASKRAYHKVTSEEQQALIKQVLENKRSINKAAQLVGVNSSTAKVIIRKHRKQLRNGAKSVKREKTCELGAEQKEQEGEEGFAPGESQLTLYYYVPTYAISYLPTFNSLIFASDFQPAC